MDASICFTCTRCGASLKAPTDLAGRTAECGKCGMKMQVPEPMGAQPSSRPSPQPPADNAEVRLPKQMMANRALAGKTCPICNRTIDLGQHVRNCELCSEAHHESCWQSHGGCGSSSCANAPLPKIESPANAVSGLVPSGPPAEAIAKPCPFCGERIAAKAKKCRYCGEYLTSVGGHRMAPPRHCGSATTSLVLGILSLSFFCIGIILGPIAILSANSAKRQIAQSRGTLSGSGMATAGFTLGIIGTVLSVIGLLGMFAGVLGS